MEPISYKEWKEKGKDVTLGMCCIITDHLLRQGEKSIAPVAKLMGEAFAKGLYEGGYRVPKVINLESERNAAMQAWDVYAGVDVEFEGTMEQYCYMACRQWQKERSQREAWEQMSLWDLWLHWFLRTFRSHTEEEEE